MAKAKGPKTPCRMAVSSLGNTLDGKIGSLGRSKYFIIFEGTPESFTVVGIPSHPAGTEAGTFVAKALVKDKVDIVITGTIGRRAFSVLSDAGVSVKAGCTGTVAEAVKKCAAGELKECQGATYAGSVEVW